MSEHNLNDYLAFIATPQLSSRLHVVPVHTVQPGWKRAPGENPSAYALESAMDELAYALKMDPITLRLANWADTAPTASYRGRRGACGKPPPQAGHADQRDGRIVNANFADYAVPLNADVPEIQAISVGIPDMQASALDGK